MAEAAISTLLQLLGNELIEKLKFLGNVGHEVQRLKKKLEWLQRFLQQAEEKQVTDPMVKKWISDLREVAFDAEDVIQIFILNIENPRKSRGLVGSCACCPSHVSRLEQVGEEIQQLWKRLDDIDKNRNSCGINIENLGPRLEWTQQPNHVEWPRRLIPKQQDKDVVGLEGDVQSLLQSAILYDKNSVSVATIVGMGGIGKSTLARIVFNLHDVVKRFDLRAWVVVSNEFEPKQIFKDLIMELLEPQKDRSEMLEVSPSEMSRLEKERLEMLETIGKEDAPKLQRRLYDRLEGKRYLIVLDDIWEDEDWTCFANAFPDNGKGSRLIITSRKQLSIRGTAQYTHPMNTLNSEESWNLFLIKALPDNSKDKCPKDLEELGRKMVEKCGGLPLAINVVGGLLLKEGLSESGWMKVLKGINNELGRGGGIVFGILELSYKALPPRLKPCFLCLSFFKEDATIRAVKLKNIWISLGYIRQEGEQRVEAVATRYMDELITRNLIRVKGVSKDFRQIRTCQVHDLIREVCIAKAKEEMGLEILTGKGSSSQPSDKPRHRALYTSLIDGESSRNKHLRSLFVCTNVRDAPSSYWKDFELLKILDLEGCVSLRELPEAIGVLIGLTYLGLKNTRVRKLPRSFCKLKNLEVIELSYGVQLPISALNFVNLRHIDGEEMHLDVPQKIRPLKCIRRLKGMVVGGTNFERQLAQITAMPNLSYLSIETYDPSEPLSIKLFNALKTSENLVRLTLSGYDFLLNGLGTLRHVTQLKIEGAMTKLPTEFPPNISHLTLKGSRLKEDPMPVLEKLLCLSYLHVHGACSDDVRVISIGGFPKLEILRFTHIRRLWRVQVGEGAMPKLKQVEIRDCWDLNIEFLKEQLKPSVNIHVVEGPVAQVDSLGCVTFLSREFNA